MILIGLLIAVWAVGDQLEISGWIKLQSLKKIWGLKSGIALLKVMWVLTMCMVEAIVLVGIQKQEWIVLGLVRK